MASNRILSPQPTNTQERLAVRLAAMEQRLSALERRRDLILTPFSISVNRTASGTATFPFTWSGGRIWIVFGGQASCEFTGGSAGYAFKVNNIGSVEGGADIATWRSGFLDPLPMAVRELPQSKLTPGSNTLNFGISGGTPTDVWYKAEGLLIEWPQA